MAISYYTVTNQRGTATTFPDFKSIVTRYRLTEDDPEFYSDANIPDIESKFGSGYYMSLPITTTKRNGKRETLFVTATTANPMGGRRSRRRSRRTLRRHNTLHRNVRRHNVK